jgi:hypothetical protein
MQAVGALGSDTALDMRDGRYPLLSITKAIAT